MDDLVVDFAGDVAFEAPLEHGRGGIHGFCHVPSGPGFLQRGHHRGAGQVPVFGPERLGRCREDAFDLSHDSDPGAHGRGPLGAQDPQ
ncbi:hypothetical protein [Arthrobacter sp. NPDC057013]|uniref:hypothetical protein n=1 Tax=Arthrobacter sp. NPDC057013 TaxID=3345999 RepID=UPI003641BAA6